MFFPTERPFFSSLNIWRFNSQLKLYIGQTSNKCLPQKYRILYLHTTAETRSPPNDLGIRSASSPNPYLEPNHAVVPTTSQNQPPQPRRNERDLGREQKKACIAVTQEEPDPAISTTRLQIHPDGDAPKKPT